MPKKDRYNGFKVPSKNGPKQTRCITHIYGMMKEANPLLLENPDVKKAFNDFVDCLLKYESLESFTIKRDKYLTGIKIDNEKSCVENFISLHCKFDFEYRNDIDRLSKESANVINSYIPLYDLIKRDVIPYMEIKTWEIVSKREIEHCHRMIQREEDSIKSFEESIRHSRRSMCKYAQRAVDLRNPPETTTFD